MSPFDPLWKDCGVSEACGISVKGKQKRPYSSKDVYVRMVPQYPSPQDCLVSGVFSMRGTSDTIPHEHPVAIFHNMSLPLALIKPLSFHLSPNTSWALYSTLLSFPFPSSFSCHSLQLFSETMPIESRQ